MIISVGESRRSTAWQPKNVSWERLTAKLQQCVRTKETAAEYTEMTRDERAACKDVGGFVAGELEGGIRKAGSVASRCIVALDADYLTADHGIEYLKDTVDVMIGCDAFLHTTHSHSPSKPRVRILIPLDRPVTAAEYEPIARRLASWIGMDYFDCTTFEPNRLMFWPSASADAEYLWEQTEGGVVSADEILESYDDWHDMRQWPTGENETRKLEHSGKAQGDPREKPGIIGAFNRAYPISLAIETFLSDVYALAGDGRYTYLGGTTTGGAVVYDDDTFLYSHHDTDPAGGRLCSAWDLVRIHLYGAEDEEWDGANIAEAPSQKAMRDLVCKDDRVAVELAMSVRSDDSMQAIEGLEQFDGDTTEQGAATDFCARYYDVIRHNKSLGWIYWDKTRWVVNADAEVRMLAMGYTDMLYSSARVAMQRAGEDKSAIKAASAAMKQANHLRSAGGLGSMLKLCEAIVNDNDTDRYDSMAWELNTPDGIIDLQTGALMPHREESYHTKTTAVGLQTGGQDRRMWQDFIDHVTGGDTEFGEYLQTLAGMAAVGCVYEEGLVISYGRGGNGKSTLWGALSTVLGEYAKIVNADVLATTSGSTDNYFVAELRGARLAVMGETEEGAKFGIAQMKRITSRDRISARHIRMEPISFRPTHTTIMHTNHLPKLMSFDGGTKRRIAVAPFPATLPPERVITNYEQLLVDRAGGAILAWIAEGSKRFYDAGCKLHKPKAVIEATEQYIAGEDWLGQFLEECCIESEDYYISCTDLLQIYQQWASSAGEYVRKKKDFISAMESLGFTRMKDSNARLGATRGMWYWRGLRANNEI